MSANFSESRIYDEFIFALRKLQNLSEELDFSGECYASFLTPCSLNRAVSEAKGILSLANQLLKATEKLRNIKTPLTVYQNPFATRKEQLFDFEEEPVFSSENFQLSN